MTEVVELHCFSPEGFTIHIKYNASMMASLTSVILAGERRQIKCSSVLFDAPLVEFMPPLKTDPEVRSKARRPVRLEPRLGGEHPHSFLLFVLARRQSAPL